MTPCRARIGVSGNAALDLAHAAVVVRVGVGDEGGLKVAYRCSLILLGELPRLFEDELHIDENRVPLAADERRSWATAPEAEPAKTSKLSPPRSWEKMLVIMVLPTFLVCIVPRHCGLSWRCRNAREIWETRP